MSLDLSDAVGNRLKEGFISRLNSNQRSRLLEAMGGDYKAFPTAKGTYRVYSYKEGDEDPDSYYTVFPRSGTPHCGCRDYFYRGQTEESNFQKCKHLWRVWIEVYAGILPPETEHPYEWLIETVESELFDVIQQLENNPDDEELRRDASQLKALRRYAEGEDRGTIDFEKAYTVWAEYKGINVRLVRDNSE